MVPIRWGQVLRIAFFQDLWQGLMANPDAMVYLLEFLLVCGLSLILFITMTYLSMAIGHLFRRRIIMSVVAFIGLDILATLYLDLTNDLELVGLVSRLGEHARLWMANAMILLPAAVLFLATSWLLKHRLNLE